MVASSSRSTILAKAFKVLRKHFKPLPTMGNRSVMENLLFACCLENSRHDKAEEGFARVQTMYFDWNEIRVATARELAESFEGLADPLAAARNLKRTLQSIFEALYRFDLEELKKQNIGQAVQQLQNFNGTTKFTIAYTVQHGLGGHSIPLCHASIDILRIVGAASEAEMDQGIVPGVERAISKDQGLAFACLVHQLGCEFHHAPNSTKWRSILSEIASDARDRFVRRPPPKLEAPASVSTAATGSSATTSAAVKKKDVQKPATVAPEGTETKKTAPKGTAPPEKQSSAGKGATPRPPAKVAPPTTKASAPTPPPASPPKKSAAPKSKTKSAKKSAPKKPDLKKPALKKPAPKKPVPPAKKVSADAHKKTGKKPTKATPTTKTSSRALARKKPR